MTAVTLPASPLRGPAMTAAAARFSVQEAHDLVKDLFTPRLRVYWCDFLLSWATAVLAFLLVGRLGYLTAAGVVAYLVSVLALYRCAVFLHEIIHFRQKRSFRRFRQVWNVLCGFPMLIPIFMYECHGEHHNKRHYGTPRDAEYVPLARLSPWRVVGVLAAFPLLPFFGPYRFGVVTPLSWVILPLRRYVYTRLSALKLDLEYEGRLPADRAERRSWFRQELMCLLLVVVAAVSFAAGWLPWQLAVQWYATLCGVILLNLLRLLAAHRYLGDEEQMSVVEQMLDTINHPKRPVLAELWAPVGLRLHALHHLMPGLPYHAYPQAHRRLVAGLPADSAYRLTESRGLWASLRTLWRTARKSRHAAPPGAGAGPVTAGGQA